MRRARRCGAWLAPTLLAAARLDGQAPGVRRPARGAEARRDTCAEVAPSRLSGISPRDTYVRIETYTEHAYELLLDATVPDPVTGRATKWLRTKGTPTHDVIEAGYDTAGVPRLATTLSSPEGGVWTAVCGPHGLIAYEASGQSTGWSLRDTATSRLVCLPSFALGTNADFVSSILAGSAAPPRTPGSARPEDVGRWVDATALVTRSPDGAVETLHFRRGPDGVARVSATETRRTPSAGRPFGGVERMRVVCFVLRRVPARDSARRAAGHASPRPAP